MIVDKIKQLLEEDDRFYYHGNGNNLGVFASYKKGEKEYEGMIDLKKDLGQKGYGTVRIFLFKEDKQGLELKIEIYLPSYCQYYTFFEGFIENEIEFNLVLKMLGIK